MPLGDVWRKSEREHQRKGAAKTSPDQDELVFPTQGRFAAGKCGRLLPVRSSALKLSKQPPRFPT